MVTVLVAVLMRRTAVQEFIKKTKIADDAAKFLRTTRDLSRVLKPLTKQILRFQQSNVNRADVVDAILKIMRLIDRKKEQKPRMQSVLP